MRKLGKWGYKNREARIEEHGYGEAWYDTEDIYRVGESPKGLVINNATTVIATIDNFC